MAQHTLSALIADTPSLLRVCARPYRWLLEWEWRVAWSGWRRRLLAGALLLGLSALVVMSQLQSVIAAMHLPGETSFSLTDLAFPGRSDAAVQTWIAHAAETTAKFSGPRLVTTVFALVDSFVLVPAYALFLAIATAEAHRRLSAAVEDERKLPADERDPLLRPYRRLSAAAFVAVPPLVLVDLLENADLVALVAWKGDAPRLFSWGLTVLWIVKWLLAIGIVVPLVLAAVALIRRSRTSGRAFLATASVLRVEIVVVLLFGLFLFGPVAADQIDDVVRRWVGPDWEELLGAVLLTLLLSAVIAAVAWRLILLLQPAAAGREPQPISPALPLRTGVLLIVIGLVLQRLDVGGLGFVSLGIVLAAIGALSYPIRNVKVTPPKWPVSGSVVLPALLAGLPPVLLGLAAIRAAVFELVYARNLEYVLLVLLGLLLQVVGWAVYLAVCRGAPTERKTPWLAGSAWPVPLAALTAAAVAVGTWLDPWRTGAVTGTVGVLAAFLIAVVLLGYLARRFEHDWLAPPFFLVFGLRRFPVFLVIGAWAVVAALFDPGGYHNIRTIDRTAGGPLTLEQAWERWLDKQSGQDEAVPLVLVAAEGGGIRAAYWTARALDCAIDADVPSCGYEPEGEAGDPLSLFAASGISGGSLGLAAYTASVLREERDEWTDERLGDDFLAAAGAWMLFTDMPNALFKFDLEPDRAGVLERAWEKAWGDDSPLADGLFETWEADSRTPLLLLSGTSVQDGCRVNNSVLDADVEEPETEKALRARDCLSMAAFASGTRASASASGAGATFAATHDLIDLLCEDEDVRLSTAALLSARFPWVSPAGRIPRCGTGFATYAVDGGYFDTSAASPIQELWARLEPLITEHNEGDVGPCVVPVLLQLDNHYQEPRSPGATGRPWESGVPFIAVRAARDARENDARQATALLFSLPTVAGVEPTDGGPLPRYAHLFPRAHPGTSAPLGWTLSQASMDDLTNQLREPANQRELGTIRRWFSDELSCEPA